MKNNETDIHELIKARRQKLKLTQAAAAKRAGVTASRWSDIEHGRYRLTIDSARRIATALGCELQIIFKPKITK